jgi:hypothetical protein
MPQFDRTWDFIGSPGFHEKAALYYDGPEIRPATTTELLDMVLSDACWKPSADRVNFMGALLALLTMPNWLNGHPFLAINDNKEGVAKSLLAKILALIVDAKSPRTISFNPNDQEFEKHIATRIRVGDRVVIIDNAKPGRQIKEIESQVLEPCVTDSILNFRLLGSNSAISRINDVLFCSTMNYTRMPADLRRRHLPANLETEANVHYNVIAVSKLEHFVSEHCTELLAEVTGMIMRWLQQGQPMPEQAARHSTSQEWAPTIDASL